MKMVFWTLIISVLLLGSGCATMIRGTTEPLHLASNPAGAEATLSNGQSCITPCSLVLPRNASMSVTFAKKGCEDHMTSVFPTLAGAGVILGGLIDYGTGAVYSLMPNPVLVRLRCGNRIKYESKIKMPQPLIEQQVSEESKESEPAN